MTPEFWMDKSIFLTGHTGFKGSWLSLWLQSMGAKVVGYALAPPSSPSLFEVAHIADGMISMEGDIRNLMKLQSAMEQHQPEIVIHMAAQSLVRCSYQNPVETFATNVMGTVNILETVRHIPSVKAVVIITSDKCYENHEWVWGYRENEAMGGSDPYSSSKGCAELVVSAYRQSFFKKVSVGSPAIASTRAGNVIGGGDWAADRLIPDLVRAITERRPMLVRNPLAIRPWQHVLEPLFGYLMLAQKLYEEGAEFAEGWNFGPCEDDAKPVQWVVECLAKLWGENSSWVVDETEHPHEANYLKLDCSKAKMRLNWQPKWSILQTLDNVVTWYQAYQRNADMRNFTLEQITNFQRK